MWCADCQQDVPAVARSAHEPLQCPRCQRELVAATLNLPGGTGDTGIALESYGQAADFDSGTADQELRTPRDWFEHEQTRQRLREINRILQTPYHQASASPIAGAIDRFQPELPSWQQPSPFSKPPPASIESGASLQSVASRTTVEPSSRQTRTPTSWLLSALLSVGTLAFCMGVALLAWSAAFQLPQTWQHGMTLTIGAEGLLILSLAWMAARLWRNSRRLNRQLHGVDRQLTEIQQHTAALVGSESASSQHFYHHFSQVANPHLLMANLQGQVDQLAARVAAK